MAQRLTAVKKAPLLGGVGVGKKGIIVTPYVVILYFFANFRALVVV